MKHLKTYEQRGTEKIEELLSTDFIESIFRKYGLTCICPPGKFTFDNKIIYHVSKRDDYEYEIICKFSIYGDNVWRHITNIKYNDILEKIQQELGADRYLIHTVEIYQIAVNFFIKDYNDCKIRMESYDLGLL